MLCDAFWGCRGEAPAPRRAPCFDTQCQNSYGVTFDKSNKTLYNGRAKDKQIADLQTENASLRGQIRSLTAQMDEIKAELWDKINNLRDKLRGAYESLTNVVKAVGMLKYDREKDQNGNYTYGKYGISNLSKAQEKLIDGLAEYGAKWAKEDGFPEMAEEMEKHVGISKGIEKIVEPPAPKRSKGWEMEL